MSDPLARNFATFNSHAAGHATARKAGAWPVFSQGLALSVKLAVQ